MTPAVDTPAMVVFSDIDGTLIDHETYSHAAAIEALTALKTRNIPLVLASSKTAAEILAFREEIGFGHCPAIVENGGGLLEPDAEAQDDDSAHVRLREALDALPSELRMHYEGFSDWSVENVAAHTGLTFANAALAKQRRFTEPGVWSGGDDLLEQFLAALSAKGVSARRGGRYLTLSFGGAKADRMAEARARYETPDQPAPFTMALGDAPNDIEMLEAADLGVVIANPHGAPLPQLTGESDGSIIRTTLPGPAGWNKAVLDTLDQLDRNDTPGGDTGETHG